MASLGCVCVVFNWLISVLWLKEAFRYRDLLGVFLVVGGVIFIILFVPKSPTAGTLNLIPCPIVYWGSCISAVCALHPTHHSTP